MVQTTQSIFTVKIALLADELLAAKTEEQRAIVDAKIKTLQDYEQSLMASAVTGRAAKAPKKKSEGRKSYPDSAIIFRLAEPVPFKFDYAQYVDGAASGERPTAEVECVLKGFLSVGNHSETTLAIEACHDVLDLKRGETYAFKAASLKRVRNV